LKMLKNRKSWVSSEISTSCELWTSRTSSFSRSAMKFCSASVKKFKLCNPRLGTVTRALKMFTAAAVSYSLEFDAFGPSKASRPSTTVTYFRDCGPSD